MAPTVSTLAAGDRLQTLLKRRRKNSPISEIDGFEAPAQAWSTRMVFDLREPQTPRQLTGKESGRTVYEFQ